MQAHRRRRAHCSFTVKRLPGGPRAPALSTGAAAMSRRLRRQRKASMRGRRRGGRRRANRAARRGAEARPDGRSRSEASRSRPTSAPPSTRAHCLASVMSAHGSLPAALRRAPRAGGVTSARRGRLGMAWGGGGAGGRGHFHAMSGGRGTESSPGELLMSALCRRRPPRSACSSHVHDRLRRAASGGSKTSTHWWAAALRDRIDAALDEVAYLPIRQRRAFARPRRPGGVGDRCPRTRRRRSCCARGLAAMSALELNTGVDLVAAQVDHVGRKRPDGLSRPTPCPSSRPAGR